ncbi:MAG: hypothetical protein ACYDCY_07045, partial [Metallibacterium sp.]
MSRQYTFSLLATALLSLAPLVGAAPAPAASSAPPARASLRQFEHDVLSIVALRSEADRLAGAAVLARAVPDLPTVLTYQTFLARATAAPGAGAAVQWVALGNCGKVGPQPEDCIDPKALARLEQLAPDNAAVWLLAFDHARQRGDDKAARTALARAAAATEFSTYYGALLHVVLETTRALPMPAALVHELTGADGNAYAATYMIAAGNVMYLPTPSLAPVFEACKAPGKNAMLRAQCVRIAHLLAWGDTVIARAAGLALQERLADGADARVHVAAERRTLAWQTQQFAVQVLKARNDRALAARLVQLVLEGGT